MVERPLINATLLFFLLHAFLYYLFYVVQMEDYMLWYLVQLFLFQCDLCYLSYGGFINHQSHKSRSHIHLCLFVFISIFRVH